MGRLPPFVLLSISCFSAILRLGSQQNLAQIDNDNIEWIASALRSIQAIKVGMTRSDLMKVFTTEGGLEFKNAPASQRTYVCRKCPYIKVDVKLAIASPTRTCRQTGLQKYRGLILRGSVMD